MAVFSIATISVRGIIASRTKRLPNSMARSISFSSPAEITPDVLALAHDLLEFLDRVDAVAAGLAADCPAASSTSAVD